MLQIVFETHSTSVDNEAGLASGKRDAPLSALGERQAAEMGERYRGEQFDAICCSDLQRTWRTAEIAFGGRGIPILRDPRLRECDYGELTMHPAAQIEACRLEHVETPFPGGESYADAVCRVREFLRDRREAERILIVDSRAAWYALESLCNEVPLREAVARPWRWQPGWRYCVIVTAL